MFLHFTHGLLILADYFVNLNQLEFTGTYSKCFFLPNTFFLSFFKCSINQRLSLLSTKFWIHLIMLRRKQFSEYFLGSSLISFFGSSNFSPFIYFNISLFLYKISAFFYFKSASFTLSSYSFGQLFCSRLNKMLFNSAMRPSTKYLKSMCRFHSLLEHSGGKSCAFFVVSCQYKNGLKSRS